MADTRAQHTPVGPGTEEADVPGMRCCGSCSGPNGPARCDVVALVLVQADRVSPARTRTEAESTSGPIVAAVSTDIDGNGCICVKPCAVLMRRALLPHMQRRRSGAVLLQAAMADPRAQHAPVGRGTEAADVPGMRSLLVYIQSSAARLPRRMADPRAQHMPVGRGTEGAGSAWYAVVVWQLLCSEQRRSQMRRSGSGGPDRRRCEH